MKKTTSKQNIIIIVLVILLLLSLAFGITYSYISGTSEQLVSGTVTTATIHVELQDESGSNTFQLDTHGNSVVPGQPLYNTQLQISMASVHPTFLAVVYALNFADDNAPDDKESLLPIEIPEGALGAGWRKMEHICKDGKTKIYMLVYMGHTTPQNGTVEDGQGYGIFPASSSGETETTIVLKADFLKVPKSWGNTMQGKTISLTFTALALQYEGVSEEYTDVSNTDLNVRANAICRLMVENFNLDNTRAA